MIYVYEILEIFSSNIVEKTVFSSIIAHYKKSHLKKCPLLTVNTQFVKRFKSATWQIYSIDLFKIQAKNVGSLNIFGLYWNTLMSN